MTSSSPAVSLWVRSEPFTYGVFQVHPHPRLALHNIKKLVTYAKSKGKTGFPKLCYPVWKHIACNKLQITEDLAWTLFQTCITMGATNLGKLKKMEEKLFYCKTEEEREQVRNVQSTELFRFVLFLYIQQINKISLRASAVSPNAEWPGLSTKSGDFESGRSTPNRPSKNLEEHNHQQFVTENLLEILDLLVEPDSYGLGGGEANLSNEAVEALSYIIEGTCDKMRNNPYESLKSFSEIAQMPVLSSRTGYSKILKSYSVRGLHSWIRSCLCPNPFSVEMCITSGKRLQWPVPGDSLPAPSGESGQGPTRRQKIATTANMLPKDNTTRGNKILVLSMVAHQTVTRSSSILQDATVKIYRCHYSYVYLLSPMRCVSVEKCRKLTLVLGSVENTLHLNQCEECTIITACRRLVVAGCRRCTVHLLTPSRPLLVPTTGAVSVSTSGGLLSAGGGAGGNEEVVLAPYASSYPRLGEHLARAELDSVVNCWDQPLVLGGSDQCMSWDLIPPTDFYPFTIPLEMEGGGTTTECPYMLPARYQTALKDREKEYTQWQQLVKDAKLNSDQRRTLRALVEQRFKNWLVESGNQRQLNLLDPASSPSLLTPQQQTVHNNASHK